MKYKKVKHLTEFCYCNWCLALYPLKENYGIVLPLAIWFILVIIALL